MRIRKSKPFALGIILGLISVNALAEIPDKHLLPEEFTVYYNKNMGISKTKFSGASETLIPTSNDITSSPGCYIACYSKQAQDSAYELDHQKYLMGQLRVKGHYANGMCIPEGYESKDFRTAKDFIQKCEQVFPERCGNKSCWVGGETAAWFD